MKGALSIALAGAVLAGLPVNAAPKKRDVDTLYPYTGPAVPVGDWVDPTVRIVPSIIGSLLTLLGQWQRERVSSIGRTTSSQASTQQSNQ